MTTFKQTVTTQMDTSKIIHISSEIILAGSIFFYLNNQIKLLRNEITELKSQLGNMENANTKHITALYNLADKLNNSLNAIGRDVAFDRQMRIAPKKPQVYKQSEIRKRGQNRKEKIKNDIDEPSESFSVDPDEELDAELGDELKELQQEESVQEELVQEDEDDQEDDEQENKLKQGSLKKS